MTRGSRASTSPWLTLKDVVEQANKGIRATNENTQLLEKSIKDLSDWAKGEFDKLFKAINPK
jgi:hypothetical protein